MGPMNAYPGWRMSGSSYDLPPGPNKIDDIYESKQDKQRKFYDNYYAEMSWRERDKIHKEYVKQKYFGYCQSSNPDDHDMNDIHPVFKIKKSSSQEDFKKIYRKLILKFHPDKPGGDEDKFIKIHNAYQNLNFV